MLNELWDSKKAFDGKYLYMPPKLTEQHMFFGRLDLPANSCTYLYHA
jgi:hypothetical protein